MLTISRFQWLKLANADSAFKGTVGVVVGVNLGHMGSTAIGSICIQVFMGKCIF